MSIKGRVAITGRPGVGKSTLIARVLERLAERKAGSVGGMLTTETRVCGRRVGFAVRDVATGVEGVLAHIHRRDGPSVGRYRVDLESLENTGIAAILEAVRSKDLVVIDEIAPMELHSMKFVPAVEAALASDRGLLISTHANADHALAHRVRQELRLFRVKLSNRDDIVDEVVDALLSPG